MKLGIKGGKVYSVIPESTPEHLASVPPEVDLTVKVDEDSNEALARELLQHRDGFRYADGVLTRDGQVRAIQPAVRRLEQLKTLRDALGTGTQAEKVARLENIARLLIAGLLKLFGK